MGSFIVCTSFVVIFFCFAVVLLIKIERWIETNGQLHKQSKHIDSNRQISTNFKNDSSNSTEDFKPYCKDIELFAKTNNPSQSQSTSEKIQLNNYNEIKYCPKNKRELLTLLQDQNIYLGSIDTSNIFDMSNLFKFSQRKDFLGIELWNTTNVINMNGMFAYTKHFNHPISKWDVSNVRDMSYMFSHSELFNQPIEDWNISKVKNLNSMFSSANSFNQNLSKWNTSSVENMEFMFHNAVMFNGIISSWNTSNVTSMNSMFRYAISFDQSIEDWDTSNVIDKANMFSGAVAYIKNHKQW